MSEIPRSNRLVILPEASAFHTGARFSMGVCLPVRDRLFTLISLVVPCEPAL